MDKDPNQVVAAYAAISPMLSGRIELRGGGWPGEIGHADRFSLVTKCVSTQGISFDYLEMPEFFFVHAATVLIVEGMVLQNFFPEDVYFTTQGQTVATGPFLLLKGQLSEVCDPPLRLRNVVLVHPHAVPENMSQHAVLSDLLLSFPS